MSGNLSVGLLGLNFTFPVVVTIPRRIKKVSLVSEWVLGTCWRQQCSSVTYRFLVWVSYSVGMNDSTGFKVCRGLIDP